MWESWCPKRESERSVPYLGDCQIVKESWHTCICQGPCCRFPPAPMSLIPSYFYRRQKKIIINRTSRSIPCLLIAHTLAASLARYKKNPWSPMVFNGTECLLIDTDICNFFFRLMGRSSNIRLGMVRKKNIKL